MADPLIIIPARYASSRFPGKPLHRFAGRTLIEHTWRAACRTRLPVCVATDSEQIAEHCRAVGADVVITGPANNGTERCAQAARLLSASGTIVNWQGDSPLTNPGWIRPLIGALEETRAAMATVIMRASAKQLEALRWEQSLGRPGATTAVVSDQFEALYFSKALLPTVGPVWLHVGVYAYTRAALDWYGTREGQLEQAERLEQLRFVERRRRVYCLPVETQPLWEINNPDDVVLVEKLMGEAHAAGRT